MGQTTSFIGTLLSGIKLVFQYIPSLPVYICTFFFCYGAYLIFLKGTSSYYQKVLKEYLQGESEEDQLLIQSGLKMNANTYTFVLFLIAIIVFLMFGFASVMTGEITQMLTGLLLSCCIIFFLRPKKYLFDKVKSPFVMLTDAIASSKRAEYDIELYNVITILKNLAIAQEGDPLSADLMLEQLMDNSKKLKPIFAEMLNIYRTGEKARAIRYFADAVGTKNGRSIALTFEKLDKIDPSELKLQVISLQEIMAEERFTRGLEKAENKGNLIFTVATISCFVCLLNFLFVCVIMDTLGMLGGLI